MIARVSIYCHRHREFGPELFARARFSRVYPIGDYVINPVNNIV